MRANTPVSFWARVDRSGGPEACWPWTGETDEHGYGRIRWARFKRDGAKLYAHRIAWMLMHGGQMPPGDGRITGLILHHCDNPPCCNPAHLYVGNRRQNAQDREDRGRSGSSVHQHLLRLGRR